MLFMCAPFFILTINFFRDYHLYLLLLITQVVVSSKTCSLLLHVVLFRLSIVKKSGRLCQVRASYYTMRGRHHSSARETCRILGYAELTFQSYHSSLPTRVVCMC